MGETIKIAIDKPLHGILHNIKIGKRSKPSPKQVADYLGTGFFYNIDQLGVARSHGAAYQQNPRGFAGRIARPAIWKFPQKVL